MRYADITSGKVNISRLEEGHPDGWIGQVRRDPGDDGAPLNMSRRILPPLPKPDEPKR